MLNDQTTGKQLASRVVLCNTFWRKFKGLMFRRSLDPDTVYAFVYDKESIVETSIHMFFVFFPIAVLWLDANRCIVDIVLAKPFRPYYASRQAARYFIEGAPSLLNQVSLGDKLTF